MGRDMASGLWITQRRSFNPRARMGRDVLEGASRGLPDVSIHAPVWGATCSLGLRLGVVDVSIHAPVWGAT